MNNFNSQNKYFSLSQILDFFKSNWTKKIK